MERSQRTSGPGAAAAIRHAIEARRDDMVAQWLAWMERRGATAPAIQRPTVRRQLGLILDVLALMAGPLRREANGLWFDVNELYGRTALIRGLAAGEVVEEVQHLRELLIRSLADDLVSLPPRQLMAAVLRLNRVLDKAIADAVVGYTDSLSVMLFAQRGVPVPVAEHENDETTQQLEALEAEYRGLAARL
jgi:cytochrome P450